MTWLILFRCKLQTLTLIILLGNFYLICTFDLISTDANSCCKAFHLSHKVFYQDTFQNWQPYLSLTLKTTAWTNKFHEYYVYGEWPVCEQWKDDHHNCMLWTEHRSKTAKVMYYICLKTALWVSMIQFQFILCKFFEWGGFSLLFYISCHISLYI